MDQRKRHKFFVGFYQYKILKIFIDIKSDILPISALFKRGIEMGIESQSIQVSIDGLLKKEILTKKEDTITIVQSSKEFFKILDKFYKNKPGRPEKDVNNETTNYNNNKKR